MLRSILLVFVVDVLVFGQHALMQDTGNHDAAEFLPVKYDVPALLQAPQTRANFIAGTPKRGIVGQPLAASFKLSEVTVCLGLAPGTKGISADIV